MNTSLLGTMLDYQRSSDLVNQGVIYLDNNDIGNALSTFEESLRLNPTNVKALQYRGICKCILVKNNSLNNSQILDEAILDFKSVIKSIETIAEATLKSR